MSQQRLTNGVFNVDFYAKIRRPDIYFKARNEAIDGTLFTYTLATAKEYYELQLSIIPPLAAGRLNDWSELDTELTFTIDLDNDPGTTITAQIVNEGRPLQMAEFGFDRFYAGTLFVREV